jgi:hypothetical protein
LANEPDHPPSQIFAFQQHENNKEEHERGRANWTEHRRNIFLNELRNGISALNDFHGIGEAPVLAEASRWFAPSEPVSEWR